MVTDAWLLMPMMNESVLNQTLVTLGASVDFKARQFR